MGTDVPLLRNPVLLPDDPVVLEQMIVQLLEELHQANRLRMEVSLPKGRLG